MYPVTREPLNSSVTNPALRTKARDSSRLRTSKIGFALTLPFSLTAQLLAITSFSEARSSWLALQAEVSRLGWNHALARREHRELPRGRGARPAGREVDLADRARRPEWHST